MIIRDEDYRGFEKRSERAISIATNRPRTREGRYWRESFRAFSVGLSRVELD